MLEAEFWVAVAFVIFLGVLGYVGVHKMIIDALDKRGARIKAELDEARKLRDEAQTLLAEYQRKTANAEREADAIVDERQGRCRAAGGRGQQPSSRISSPAAPRWRRPRSRRPRRRLWPMCAAPRPTPPPPPPRRSWPHAAKGKVAETLIARGIEDVKNKLN